MAEALVSVLIATKDRPDDLRRTLRELRRQIYPAIELIVIDDGSAATLESMVREEWPQAVYVRHAESAGQCQRRSEGFQLAKGEYILQLDDDSCPVAHDAISQAARTMESNPTWGALSFYIFNGAELPGTLPAAAPRYFSAFVGCGVFFRAGALRQVGGYRAFFGNEWEEEELSLRLLAGGWVIYFHPSIVIHHHVSGRNRNQVRTWTRQTRNKLWAMLMNMPFPYLLMELAWTSVFGFVDAVRMFRFVAYGQAIVQCSAGLPRVLRLRAPMSRLSARRYYAIRFQNIDSQEAYLNPPKWNWGAMWNWFTGSWMNRARQRSFWDRRPGDTGLSPTVGFAHQYRGPAADDKKV
jgi:GT2 family glycosyltransferase